MNASAPILICYDGSDDAQVAIARAGALFPHRDAIVLAVWQRAHATPPFITPAFTYTADPSSLERLDATAERAAAGLAAAGAELALAAGLRARPLHAGAAGPVAETMLNVAAEQRVAAIVVGSRGRGGIKSALLGSVSNHLVHHTSRPTFVVRHDAPDTAADAPIALCYDGSADAGRAIEHAGALFGARDAIVLTAWQSAYAMPAVGWGGAAYLPDYEEIERSAQRAAADTADAACALAQAAGLSAQPRVVRATGSVWPALVGAADEAGAVAIVVGSRGLSETKSMLLGSVSGSVMHHTKRPVLVVSRAARAAASEARRPRAA